MRVELQQIETDECITVAEAKLHCRVDIDDEDDWFTREVISARQYVEKHINGAVLPQTLIVYYDANEVNLFNQAIKLPSAPVISITSVNSYDSESSETVFSESNYFLSGDRIAINDSASWPTNLRGIDALAIEFVAGFGTKNDQDEFIADVPKDLKQAMLKLLAHWYQNRGDEEKAQQIPGDIYPLLSGYRRFTL